MKSFHINEVHILLGENENDNDSLLKVAHNDHIWLHLDKFPSGHAVIQTGTINDELLHFTGQKCLENTKFRHLKNVKIVYTKISNVKLTEKKGEVIFKSNRKTNRFKLN